MLDSFLSYPDSFTNSFLRGGGGMLWAWGCLFTQCLGILYLITVRSGL